MVPIRFRTLMHNREMTMGFGKIKNLFSADWMDITNFCRTTQKKCPIARVHLEKCIAIQVQGQIVFQEGEDDASFKRKGMMQLLAYIHQFIERPSNRLNSVPFKNYGRF